MAACILAGFSKGLIDMTKVAIAGAAGRMGRTLIQAVDAEGSGLKLAAATVLADDPCLGVDAGLLAIGKQLDVKTVASLAEASDFDVLIDFTFTEASLAHLDYCREQGKAMVLGTTGFTPEQQKHINGLQDLRLVFAPNMSVGVNLCLSLLEKAASVLGDSVDIEISEAHHRFKKDAPSGTALKMGQVIADTLGRDLQKVAVYGREGMGEERDRSTIGFSTLRAGDIVGDHTVTFASLGERVEITHKASSRMTFASGAVRAAGWIVSQPPGVYSMTQVLGLD